MAQVLGLAVAVMGIAFLAMAVAVRPSPADLIRGLLVPALPAGSGLLALGLVGTTVVPYNLFLGSGLARDQDLPTFRFGLAVAVILGGAISMGIVVVGSQVALPFSFAALADTLGTGLGDWARVLFAVGLFSAGMSSAITAPLAAALTARSLFADVGPGRSWTRQDGRYRAVWGSVLAFGLLFGVSGVRPVPVIVLAQALNGIVLPAVAIYLLIAVNDRRLMGEGGLNGGLSNSLMVIVTLITTLLGVVALARVAATLAGVDEPAPATILVATTTLVALALIPLWRLVRLRRAG